MSVFLVIGEREASRADVVFIDLFWLLGTLMCFVCLFVCMYLCKCIYGFGLGCGVLFKLWVDGTQMQIRDRAQVK